MGSQPLRWHRTELAVTGADWELLRSHLFQQDGDEHGAAVLCGVAHGPRTTRLLVRHVILAEDGIDYIPGTRGYRHLTGEFVTRQVRRARDERLVYLAAHNHGGSNSVRFSASDLASHERGYPTLVGITRQAVGGLVFAPRAAAGDIWLPDGGRTALTRVVVLGRQRDVLMSAPVSDDATVESRFHRQALMFGPHGQAVLGEMKVAVVGLGGVGMLLVQTLARLGVGHLVAVDPDRVDPTNLSRLPEATRRDAMALLDRDGVPLGTRRAVRRLAATKVRVARRIALRANRGITFEGVVGDIADADVAHRITDADFIFLAADTMLARSVVNQISYQYLIPTLQVGSKVVLDAATGAVRDVFAVVRSLGTSPGCLYCNGLINTARLSEEVVGNPLQRANQRYVDDPHVHAPSVITLNDVGTGWAAQSFMEYATGIGHPVGGFQLLRTTPRTTGDQIENHQPHASQNCHVCGSAPSAARALGDGRELPTRS